MIDNYSYLTISFFVGFIGDLILQSLPSNYLSNYGLDSYFNLHHPIESMTIAGGLMFILSWIYLFLNIPLNIFYLALFGIGMDLCFRHLNIYPSLNDYYSKLNHFWTGLWGAIPMVLPYIIYKLIMQNNIL